jgi:hypothetical protein
MNLWSRRFWLVFLAANCLAGCLSSPTLPLPPPSPAPATVPENGTTELKGTVPDGRPGVRVLALNQRTGLVFGQDLEDRRFAFRAAAVSGDVFTLWYTASRAVSEPVEVLVPFADKLEARSGPTEDAATILAPDAGGDAGGDRDEN